MQIVFGFTRKSRANRLKKAATVLREFTPSVPLMVSIFIFLAFGAASGTFFSSYASFNGFWVTLLIVVSGGCVSLTSYLLCVEGQPVVVRRIAWWVLLIGIAFAMCCWAWCCARLFARDDMAWSLTESSQPIVVQGSVVEAPEQMTKIQGRLGAGKETEMSTWVLQLGSARHLQHWVPVSGYARVFVNGRPHSLLVGTHVRLYGRAMRPSSPNNPGEFDYRRHSQVNRVLTIIRVRDWSSIVVCSEGVTHSATRCVDWLRQLLRDRLHAIVPSRSQPLSDSLLLGLRRTLPEQTIRVFSDTGCIHILAISGLHVGLVATVVFYVLRFLGCPYRMGWLCVTCVITVYAGITGAALPVLRATLLLWVACAGVLTKRRMAGLHSLAVVGVILLIWNPVSVLAVGSQLSFLATAVLISLGAFSPKWQTREAIQRLIEKNQSGLQNTASKLSCSLRWGIMVSASVWVASAPLVASEFNRFVPFAVGANLLIAPLLPIVMAAGFVCLVTAGLPVAICAPLGWLTGSLSELLTLLLKRISSLPGSAFRVYALPTWWVVIWYVVLFLFLLHLCSYSKKLQASHGIRFESLCGRGQWSIFQLKTCIFLVFLFGLSVLGVGMKLMPKAGLKKSQITIAGMGHGCGIVVKTREGHCLLYDAGRLGAPGTALRSIRATLFSNRIHTIDYMVLSHADTDHFNAVPGILEEFRVGQVIVSPQFLNSSSRSAIEVKRLFVKHEVPIRTVLAGDVIRVGTSCVARVLHPQIANTTSAVSDNQSSIVLDLSIELKRVLFTGDIEGDALRELLHSGLPHCDILIAPHHGNTTGFSREIVSRVRPRAVIVSGSGGRDWPRVCRNFYQGWSGLRKVLRTAGGSSTDHGAVLITMNDDAMTVQQFRSNRWRCILQ